MKIREILVEFKKGVKAVKHNKKTKDPAKDFAKAKEKLEPVKPMEESRPKGYDSFGNPLGGGYDEYHPPETKRPQEIKRHYFKVPYDARDKAKLYGMRWDNQRNMWYKPQYDSSGRTFAFHMNEIEKLFGPPIKLDNVAETATPGATSAGNVAVLGMNPKLSPGPARGKKSYTGSPGKSGTKAPPQPKVKQPKSKYGTAKNALDMKHNIFGGGAIKRK